MASNKYLWSILFAISLLTSLACAQERMVDTIFVDKHKVTYVIDTSSATTTITHSDSGSLVPVELYPEDTLKTKAPPNDFNRFTLSILATNLSFLISYEHLFSDFWGAGIQLNYNSFSSKDIRTVTDVDGSLKAFAVPLFLRWYYARRNIGIYRYIDSNGGMSQEKKQLECGLQLQAIPVLYNVDLSRDSTHKRGELNLNDKEFGLAFSFGLVCHFLHERFFWGSELNFGSIVSSPNFRKEISVSKEVYNTYLLNKYFYTAILEIGFVF